MQIHEVTIPPAVGNLAKSAVQGAKNLGQRAVTAIGQTEPFQKAKAVLTTPGGLTTARGYAAAIDSVERAKAQKTLAQYDQMVAQQTSQLSKQWTQDWIKQAKSSGMTGTTGKPPPGGMSSAMAASKTGQNLQTMYGTPKGGIEGMKSDLEEAVNPNQETFRSWAEAKLASNIPARSGLTMDTVKKQLDPKEKTALTGLLARIGVNPEDAVAVEQYFETYMQAMQRISQEQKQTRRTPSGTGVGIGDNPFPMIVNDNQFKKMKNWVKGDAVKAAILKKALEIQ